MARMIPVGGRAFFAPDHIKFVSWRPLRSPYRDVALACDCYAAVVVETYHDSHFVPCATADAAAALVAEIMAAVAAGDLRRELDAINDSPRDDNTIEWLESRKRGVLRQHTGGKP